jgi:hypothetical protein
LELAKWASEFDFVLNERDEEVRDVFTLSLPAKTQAEYLEMLKVVRSHFEEHAPADPAEIRKDPKFEPLAWWKLACSKYPAIAAVAFLPRLVFCVPATSAPSERVFSALNATVTRHRSLLTDYKREMLTVIRAHLATTPLPEFLQRCAASIRTSKKRGLEEGAEDRESDEDEED